MDKTLLLDRLGATGEDRLLLAKVLDRAKQARDRNIPSATDFLSPQQQMLSLDLLRLAGISETDYVLSGGFDGAEADPVSAGLAGRGNCGIGVSDSLPAGCIS